MRVAVSPYHLTTREPPAMGAFLLADEVVTLRPTPEGGRAAAEAAAEQVPVYRALLESWAWTAALWREGVVRAHADGDDPADDALDCLAELHGDDRLAELRPLLRPDDADRFPEAAARDLLRGGPDPGVSVPISGGLDRFASRHGLVVVRARPVSVAQRAEARLAERLASFAVPALVEAEGVRLLEARAVLGAPLDVLRAELDSACERAWVGREVRGDTLRAAAHSLTEEFELVRAHLTRPDDEVGRRVRAATVSCTLVRMPADAVFVSSLAAARAMGRRADDRPVRERFPADDLVLSLVIKVMGARG